MEKFKLVTKDIRINCEEIKKFIIDEWQSGELYKFYYKKGDRGERLYRSVLGGIADYADDIEEDVIENVNLAADQCLDWSSYPKFDKRSIGIEVLGLLGHAASIPIERLTIDDIPTILAFLDTPPGKELEAWDKWEKYWANLDYAGRRKKLLESSRK